MSVWLWIVVIVAVLGVVAWLARRGTFGRGYNNDHQGERDANRQRFDDPRGSGPHM